MRRSARTDLCGGRSVMIVPTASSCRKSARCVTLCSMPTYLRFIVPEIPESSAKELGVFHAVLRLREEGKTAPARRRVARCNPSMVQRELGKTDTLHGIEASLLSKPEQSNTVV